jgi:hypothetical protein
MYKWCLRIFFIVASFRLKNVRVLQSHMIQHKSEKDDNVCDICGKKAPNKGALQSHKRNIHVDRTHKCSVCDKAFKRAINLRVSQFSSLPLWFSRYDWFIAGAHDHTYGRNIVHLSVLSENVQFQCKHAFTQEKDTQSRMGGDATIENDLN